MSSRIKAFQDSFNKTEWKEDPTDARMRAGLSPTTPVYLKRQLYPLSARMLRTSPHYAGMKAGAIVRYARTRLTPSGWPIECLIFDSGGHQRFTCFSSDEAELILPVED